MKKSITLNTNAKRRVRIAGFFVGITSLLIGLYVLVPSIYYSQRAEAGTELPITYPKVAIPETPQTLHGKPIQLTIPSVNIDIPVVDGVYNEQSGTWNALK